jgi:hypothetical protein
MECGGHYHDQSGGMEEWQIDANRAYTGEREHEIEIEEVSAMYIGTEA